MQLLVTLKLYKCCPNPAICSVDLCLQQPNLLGLLVQIHLQTPMEAIIFCGIQATGKTTFYKENFLKTHIRISLDMLNTRNKESQFLQTCIQTQQKFVVDNTNLTKEERLIYIEKAKAAKFKIISYYFQSKVNDAIDRNKSRPGKECIPERGIRGASKKLELPAYNEGFDQLFYVEINGNQFIIKEWQHEV